MLLFGKLIGLLAILVSALTTTIGTWITYIVLRFIWGVDFRWWLDLPIAVGFYLVWHWGGFFFSSYLIAIHLKLCSTSDPTFHGVRSEKDRESPKRCD